MASSDGIVTAYRFLPASTSYAVSALAEREMQDHKCRSRMESLKSSEMASPQEG